jgi:uncharacterized surface protein with fasciclin (FAS1) repeats
MKRKFWKQFIRHVFYTCALFTGLLWTVSCEDDYKLDDNEPDWLGASIYDYLKENGNYTYFTQLIDDVGYKDVLQKTGSKTLFVATDSAFNRFFQNNPWGVTSYSGLSLTQKKLILNFSMINNAYLIETLSNYNNGGLVEGRAMRRATAISVMDSIPFDKGDALPNGTYWNKYKERGIYLLKDNTSWPMVHFLQRQLENDEISDEDFQVITGLTRSKNDAHIFDNKVIARDITCKNGYINVLENVLIPPMNMANYIFQNPNTSTFSNLLHRFCAPYYSLVQTEAYRKLKPGFNDSIYVKLFYTVAGGGGTNYYPNNSMVKTTLLLSFDPGWNSYNYNSSIGYTPLQADMATMFVPTNEAMEYYFNTGTGKLLKERYGSLENVPDDIAVLLIKRHMRRSFIESVPSRFPKMNDDENFPIPAKNSDIVDTYIGVNGLVYIINNVYGPFDYESCYAPVLFSEKTKVFNWAIIQNEFRLYLNSYVSRYSFFVPTDEYLTQYIDPFTIGKDMPGALKFWYNNASNSVNATVYKYNVATNTLGDSVGVITSAAFVSNRLLDLLDSHIIVGNVESGKKYYLTKGGNIIKVNGTGMGLTVEGGGDIDLGTKSNVVNFYAQANGNTYFIDKPIQMPLRSVYKVLSTTPEFSEFFNLLNGFQPSSNSVIFVKKQNYWGIDFNIKFFSTYNYSVYIPTNQAIQEAIANGVISPWESQPGIVGINDMTDIAEQNAAILKLERFLRYHFQDNSVFISGIPVQDVYTSATLKTDDIVTRFTFFGREYETFKNKYYKIGVAGSGTDLSLTTTKGTANVITQNGLYNIITRDYIFNANPGTYKEIDGSGSGTGYSSSSIYTSSTAVLHQIDKVLLFE